MADQCLLDTLNYGFSKFFLVLDKNMHLPEKQFKQQISSITNLAACMFFFTVQVPLSRLSPGFAFLTCFVVWFIDHETKAWLYQIFGAISRFDFSYVKVHFDKEFEFFYQDVAPKPKAKKEDLRAVADWFALHLVIFMSLTLNYVYRVAFA
jgi:hypothetical protein